MSANTTPPADRAKRAQPESFRARALSNSLTVKDLAQSVAWYRDVVGFTVDQQYEREGKLRAVSLKAGSIRILLNQDDGGRGWDRTKGEGFSFQLTTAQSVDEIAQRIKVGRR
jgi:catechol 2,3-dioxygenase-like lactoylglutathione lyase family enzyme